MTAPRPFAEVIAELTRLDAAATPGPWNNCSCGKCGQVTGTDCAIAETFMAGRFDYEGVPCPVGEQRDANAALIAAMRNALPRLLSRLASREAVFEAAVAWQRDEMTGAPKLRAAIAQAREAEGGS